MVRLLISVSLAALFCTAAYAQNSNVHLWKNFRIEMSADEVVAALISEGVRSKVEVDKSTGIRFVQVSGKEKERYVLIGDARFEPTFAFTSRGCAPLRWTDLDRVIPSKLPNFKPGMKL